MLAFAAPRARLLCNSFRWRGIVRQLRERGAGRREAGCFLLGVIRGPYRCVREAVYYDDVDPGCLDAGGIDFDGVKMAVVWQRCRDRRLSVVADVHTHPGAPIQSTIDEQNPAMSLPGHIGIIVPNFAARCTAPSGLGIYQYQGAKCWKHIPPETANDYFYMRWWL